MPDSPSVTIQSLTSSPVLAAVASNVGTTVASGDGTVLGLTALLNGLGQVLKHPTWFKQNTWMFPVLLVAGIGLAWLVTDDGRQAILKGGMAAWNAVVSYKGLGPDGIGVLGRGTD